RRPAALRARGLLRILGALRARPVAQLGHVAGPDRGPALGPGMARRVLAGVVGPVALVERAGIRVLGARRAARLLLVRRAGLSRDARAGLDLVALARRRAADKGARPHHVARAGGAGTGAVRLRVADVPRARVADGAGVACRVLAGIVGPVTLIERAGVAVVGARRGRRGLRIRRAGHARHAGAELLHVARAGHGAAHGGARRRQGRRAGRARPGAVLRRITVVPRAEVADRVRVAGRVLAGVAQPIARIERAGVAVVGALRAGRLLPIGGAIRTRAGAELRRVALVDRRSTLGRRGLEGVGGALVAAPVAGLSHIAV